MKKVLIVTLPLGINYGGILQAYALQQILLQRGYLPETTSSSVPTSIRTFISSNSLVRKIFRKPPLVVPEVVAQNTAKFIEKRIRTVPFEKAVQKANNREYALLISGSDQVWRKSYANVKDNLFGFLTACDVRTISYAASFGKGTLENYSKRLIDETKELAQKLCAVSVRENSGVALAEKYWGVNAEVHLDPTMLLDQEDYLQLIERSTCNSSPVNEPAIFAYVLDNNLRAGGTVEAVSTALDLPIFQLIDGDGNGGKVLPPLEDWLRSIYEAKFVVTDSFHGTVFAILFQKPFLSICNEARGSERFVSLLDKLGLSSRLLRNGEIPSVSFIEAPIDWERVESARKIEVEHALGFLASQLTPQKGFGNQV